MTAPAPAALEVVGLGLVSPLGDSATEHAFFVRAEVAPASAGAFLGPDGEPLPLATCPWLDADVGLAARCQAMALRALAGALAGLAGAAATLETALIVVAPGPRAGLTADAVRAIGHALEGSAPLRFMGQKSGAAGFFAALAEAAETLARGGARAVAVVAFDSMADVAALEAWSAAMASPWTANLPRPSEGAAAVLVMSEGAAQRHGLSPLVRVRHCGVQWGEGHDDDDLPASGAALAHLLRAAAVGPVVAAFGPQGMGDLRTREWQIASARAAAAFDPDAEAICVEHDLGCLGAAAGAFHFAAGVTALVHDTWPHGREKQGPCVAWAISPDGTRGLASFELARRDRHAAAPRAVTRGAPVLLAMSAREGPNTPLGAGPAPVIEAPTTPLAAGPAPAREAPTTPLAAGPAPVIEAPPAGESANEALNERLSPRRRGASITRDGARVKAAGRASHLGEVVADGVDRMAACSRQRLDGPLSARPAVEARLLAQLDAIAEAGPSFEALIAIANEGADDPWVPAAAALAVGSLAAPGAVEALVAMAETALLAEGVLPFAESVLLAPFAGAAELAARLRTSALAPARAAAVEIAAGLSPLDPAALPGALGESAPCVWAALLRSHCHGPRHQAVLERARACLSTSDPELAWQAARLLTLWGEPDAHRAVQSAQPLARVLGVRALDVLALAGGPEDLAVAQSLVRRLPASEAALDAIARLGHPGSWAYLVHHLDKDDLGEAAERALVTLFGPLVAEGRRHVGAAWRDAMAEAESIPEGRCRGGAPWSLAGVLAGCANRELSRRALEQHLDEVMVHTGKPIAAELWRWGEGAFLALKPALAAARH